MNHRLSFLAPGAILLASLMVLVETLYFGSRQPGYRHLANTISELGEAGAPHAGQVAFGFFLPVGLLVWLALWLTWRAAADRCLLPAMIALSSLGAGYAAAAFFPCDPGAPFFGTWRAQVHNLVGFIDYEGTGIGFLLVSRYYARRRATLPALAFVLAGAWVLLCLALLSLEGTFPVRGLIQRLAELIQFAGVFFVCFLFSKKITPPDAGTGGKI